MSSCPCARHVGHCEIEDLAILPSGSEATATLLAQYWGSAEGVEPLDAVEGHADHRCAGSGELVDVLGKGVGRLQPPVKADG
jgi:hypothetical protein